MKRCPTCGSEFADDALYCQWDGAPLAPESAEVDPYVGQVLKDQFEIVAPIGQGGMGTVYRAVQRGFDRTVAVKILHSDLARNPEVLGRFHREAKIASRLEHPNIVHVYQFGDLPDNNLFLAMEFLDGQSLLDVLRREGALEVGRVIHIAVQICGALGEAHEAGIIHRDLKPENIMLVRRGSDPDFVKILDFGIAKFVTSEAGDVHTQQGLVFGTARYISPEGASGDPVDSRSDVYSLGVVLYQMLSGEVPFHSENPISLLLMHINDEPPPLRSRARATHVPPAVEEVVMRALAKRPASRYANAREFGQALAEAAARSSISMPVHPVVARGRSEAPRSRVPSVAPPVAKPVAKPAAHPSPPPPVAADGALPPIVRTLEGPAVAPSDVRDPAFLTESPSMMPATRLQPAYSAEELEARARDRMAESFSTSAGTVATPMRTSRADPLATTDPAGESVGTSSVEVRLPSSRGPVAAAIVIVVLLLGAAAGGVYWVRTHADQRTTSAGTAESVAAANTALAAGQLPGAVELLEKAIALEPQAPSVVDLKNRIIARLESDADQARREGRLTAARDSLRLLLRLDPAHARARSAIQTIETTLASTTESAPQVPPIAGNPPVGPPTVTVSAAETAFVGRSVHLTARLTGIAPGTSFAQPKFRLTRRGPGERHVDVPATTGGDAGTFYAEFAFPKAGTWEVAFTVMGGGAPIEGQLALAVHLPVPGGPFTTGGGSADLGTAADGGAGLTQVAAPGGPDGGTATDTPTTPTKIRRRRTPPPPPPPPDHGGGGRWM